jgi:hypothetical protein
MFGKKTKTTAGLEWIGAVVPSPAYVTGEGQPFRPDILVILGARGEVLGSLVARPGQALAQAAQCLHSTIKKPMVGRARTPVRVRVADPALADAMRAAHSGVEIICAPTPEIADFAETLNEAFGGVGQQSYLSDEIDPQDVAAFFRAARVLFRAEPWAVVPSDECAWSVSIPELELRDAVVSVIGQAGKVFGVALFAGAEQFHAYLAAADAVEDGEQRDFPPHMTLIFGQETNITPELCAEIAEHGWELEGPNAYPWLSAVDSDMSERTASIEELTLATAICLALPKALAEPNAILDAWNGGSPIERRYAIDALGVGLDVTLRVPHSGVACADGVVESCHIAEPFARLQDLGRAGVDASSGELQQLQDELMRRFTISPEAAHLERVGNCRLLMDFAASYFGATIATLRPAQLRQIVFDVIPRQVTIDASEASWIVEESRAFYGFLAREFVFDTASEYLQVLGEGAVEKLGAALSRTAGFGMTKALLVAGAAAGFDVNTKAGLDAWMRTLQSNLLPNAMPAPPFGSVRPSTNVKRARKANGKAQRRARKKSR